MLPLRGTRKINYIFLDRPTAFLWWLLNHPYTPEKRQTGITCLVCLFVCHAMPCHAMPCHAMSCHAMPCHAMPCHAMSCHAMPCRAVPCRAMPCHAMPCHAMPYHTIPYHIMLCTGCLANAGLMLDHRLSQHWTSIGWAPRVCWDAMSNWYFKHMLSLASTRGWCSIHSLLTIIKKRYSSFHPTWGRITVHHSSTCVVHASRTMSSLLVIPPWQPTPPSANKQHRGQRLNNLVFTLMVKMYWEIGSVGSSVFATWLKQPNTFRLLVIF